MFLFEKNRKYRPMTLASSDTSHNLNGSKNSPGEMPWVIQDHNLSPSFLYLQAPLMDAMIEQCVVMEKEEEDRVVEARRIYARAGRYCSEDYHFTAAISLAFS